MTKLRIKKILPKSKAFAIDFGYFLLIIIKLDPELTPVTLAALINGENLMLQEVDLLQILYECIDSVLEHWDASHEEKVFTIACLNAILHIFPTDTDNLEC